MSAPFPNVYTHRKVAESASKACDVCYKPSTSVLITPDKKDFFYICPAHLKDRYFCTPKVDEEAEKAKREKELAEEKEKLKKEYEEKLRKKKEKEAKEKKKGSDKEKETTKDQDENDENETKKEEQPETEKSESPAPVPDEPRIFELKTTFYQQRLTKKRQAEAARRDRERASQPGYFPSVPTDLPGR